MENPSNSQPEVFLTGQDRTGQDRTGQDRTGQDRTGRVLWLDVARVFAALAVITYHVRDIGNEYDSACVFLGRLSLYGAVPFFMFFTAYFIKRTAGFAECLNKSVRIVIPLVLWGVIYCFCRGNHITSATIIGIPNGLANGQLWFLHDLVILYVCTPLLCRLGRLMPVVAGLLILVGILPKGVPTWGLIPQLGAAGWFLLGLCARKFSLSTMESTIRKYVPSGLVLLLIVIAFMRSYLSVFMGRIVVEKGFEHGVGVLLLCALGITVVRYFPRVGRVLASLAPACFTVYVMQLLVELYYPEAILNNVTIYMAPLVIFLVTAVTYFIGKHIPVLSWALFYGKGPNIVQTIGKWCGKEGKL